MKKYQANLMLNDKKVTYTAHGRKFEVKIVETTAGSSTPYVGYLEMEVSIPPRNTPPPPPYQQQEDSNDDTADVISISSNDDEDVEEEPYRWWAEDIEAPVA